MEDHKTSIVAAALVVCLGAGLAYYLLRPEPASAPAPVLAKLPPALPQAPSSLPALDESDAFVGARLAALADVPKDWLSAGSLVRRLVAAARIVSQGGSPRESLAFLAPAKPFSVWKQGGRVYLDERSYKRYDAAAAAVASMDVSAAARLVSELSPLFAQACAELDAGRCDFRADVLSSCRLLLETPVVRGPIRLRRKISTWAFFDPKLEALTPAQKSLLRMGPANELKLQAKLRELSAALSGA